MPVNTISFNSYYQANSKPRRTWQSRARQPTPITSGLKRGQAVGVDCEGVELLTRDGNTLTSYAKKGLGEVSVVHEDGRLLYNTFVYQPSNVTWTLPPQRKKLGVKWGDVRPENGAQPLDKVLADLKTIFDATGIIVAHGIINEIHYLRPLDLSVYELRDTQKASVYRQYAKVPKDGPSLADLSAAVLDYEVQKKGHSATEDTRATVDAYKLERAAIDAEQAGMKFGADSVPWAAPPITTTVGSSIPAPAATSSASSTNSNDGNVSSSSDSGDSSSQTGSLTTSTATTATTATSTGPLPHTAVTTAVRYQPALPNLPGFGQGRAFDKRTSRYV
ncbi:hypothetical protein PRZ48_003794 [Zasmidium cellare]|uniref:Exonuclease domain-containing protein n=1 Tax=Zasmidium cellare TaxID=395010 RepID=A0ABR0EWV7_ZASCE|nr:hypothetical protein PRZ48_003794 [Zasmidium cellare]